ncbi:unnamed protein product [Oikopleura dioica]|uniref:Uncharacterized protein n=1 Tax=Oikopleura dioica TaxID=34765 RepID=E4XAH6_OIKDI|nr:unnamed protein product [Oikopleura dioica]
MFYFGDNIRKKTAFFLKREIEHLTLDERISSKLFSSCKEEYFKVKKMFSTNMMNQQQLAQLLAQQMAQLQLANLKQPQAQMPMMIPGAGPYILVPQNQFLNSMNSKTWLHKKR